MKKIHVVTKYRGFLIDLFKYKSKQISFIYKENNKYETKDKFKNILAKLFKLKIFNYFGFIYVPNFKKIQSDSEYLLSFNKFLKSDKNYIIYLETPLSLINYQPRMLGYFIPKKKINNLINDVNLKAIVCMSKACYDTLHKYYELPTHLKVKQIYPLITPSKIIRDVSIKSEIKLIYVSSNFTLKGGKELVVIMDIINKKKTCFTLEIITKKNSIPKNFLSKIKSNKYIELTDFNLNKKDLSNKYNSSDILMNLTRQDSFSLVTLEAVKHGLAIISTDLFAIKEMVIHGQNGYLVNQKYNFYNSDNSVNQFVWENRKQTIYSDYIDRKLIKEVVSYLTIFSNSEKTLKNFKEKSKIISSELFSDKKIIEKWEILMEEI